MSRRRRDRNGLVLAGAVALALALGLTAAPAQAAFDPAAIDRAQRAALTEADQPTLPGVEAEGSATAEPARTRRRPQGEAGGRRRDSRTDRYQPPSTGVLGTLLGYLMWAVVLVGAGVLVVWLVGELSRPGDAEAQAEADAAGDERAARAALVERPLGDADQLAARGAFAEAIHTLLLRTLHELAASAAVRVGRAHTSREILARVPLRADAQGALAGLIATVELTHFGDDPASEADWARCREQYQRFAAAFRAGGLTTGALVAPAAGGQAPTRAP
ncbi:MAG: DUF4129 domain-containing protein [Kofleriaceae bacterium]|nr:DUF4129 domain-containing protein [Kofleriaceae bacterium]MBP6837785.1 DUF4129 domain-containing protein [Kofleriaceae bacterium]MBP9207586.1 DUF4129 domain-containing protein [Kofleriaceae bacterium]